MHALLCIVVKWSSVGFKTRGAFHQAFCQCFSLTTVISYWNPCIWLAESKFVSEKHWQNAWWNAPLSWSLLFLVLVLILVLSYVQSLWDFHFCAWTWSRHLWSRTQHWNEALHNHIDILTTYYMCDQIKKSLKMQKFCHVISDLQEWVTVAWWSEAYVTKWPTTGKSRGMEVVFGTGFWKWCRNPVMLTLSVLSTECSMFMTTQFPARGTTGVDRDQILFLLPSGPTHSHDLALNTTPETDIGLPLPVGLIKIKHRLPRITSTGKFTPCLNLAKMLSLGIFFFSDWFLKGQTFLG